MKKVFIFILLISSSLSVYCQNVISYINDLGRLSLTPVVSRRAEIPGYAAELITNLLNSTVTQYGLSSRSAQKRFVITANIVVVSHEITATAPPIVSVVLVPTFYIGDLETGNLYSSYTHPTIRGVGTNETKAYLSAVKTINLNTPGVRSFIEEGKMKLIEYYGVQAESEIARANGLANAGHYDEAIGILFEVPSVCESSYQKALHLAATIYQKKIDEEGEHLLRKAQSVWDSGNNRNNGITALDHLAAISPYASCMTKANALGKAIAEKMKELDDREWAFRMRQYEDAQKKEEYAREEEKMKTILQHKERMLVIEAAEKIGTALASRPVTKIYNFDYINWW